jgi:hypothetical protein
MEKISICCSFYGRCIYKYVEYTPVKLRLMYIYAPEELGEFHAQEAAECHQEGGEPHQVLAKGAGHT